MRVLVTVEVEAVSRELAVSALAGYDVVRVSVPRIAAPEVSPIDMTVRASAHTDMPDALDYLERKAYVAGYGRACMTYVRKHGGASLPHSHADRDTLSSLMRRHEWDRHPAAHKAAMAALRKERAHPSRNLAAVPLSRTA